MALCCLKMTGFSVHLFFHFFFIYCVLLQESDGYRIWTASKCFAITARVSFNSQKDRFGWCTADIDPSSFCYSGSFLWLMFSCLIYLWRFLCWQMYSFYCNFPFTEYEVQRHARSNVFKGGIKLIHLTTATQTLYSWRVVCVEGQYYLEPFVS